MGLLKPFQVLLLDEITVDLDVLGRADLMGFLKDECRERGATIIYVRPPRVWGGERSGGGRASGLLRAGGAAPTSRVVPPWALR